MRPVEFNGAQRANHDYIPRPATLTPRQRFEAGPETVKGATERFLLAHPGFFPLGNVAGRPGLGAPIAKAVVKGKLAKRGNDGSRRLAFRASGFKIAVS